MKSQIARFIGGKTPSCALAVRQLEIVSTAVMMIGQMLRITKVRPNILTINLRCRHTTTWDQCQESRNLLDIEALQISGTDEGKAKISFDFIVRTPNGCDLSRRSNGARLHRDETPDVRFTNPDREISILHADEVVADCDVYREEIENQRQRCLHFNRLLRPPYAPVIPDPGLKARDVACLCIRNAARVYIGELVVKNGPQHLNVLVEHGCVPAVFHRFNFGNVCFNNHHHLLCERLNMNTFGRCDAVLHIPSHEQVIVWTGLAIGLGRQVARDQSKSTHYQGLWKNEGCAGVAAIKSKAPPDSRIRREISQLSLKLLAIFSRPERVRHESC